MRVLLSTPDSLARLHHLTPLAWALRTAGHEVLVAAPPSLTAAVQLTGLVVAEPGPDGLAGFAAAWGAGMVVWDRQAPTAADAARSAGALGVCLRGLADHRTPSAFDDCGADLVVDTTPPPLRSLAAEPDLAMRHIPYDGLTEIPSWLRRKPRRERVYLHGLPRPGVLPALAGLPFEIICATPLDRLPASGVPDNVRVLDAVPFAALAPTCAAVLHSGQSEVVAAAVVAGLVEIDLTTLADDALAERVVAAVRDPGVRDAAAGLRDAAWAMPAPGTVAARLARRVTEGVPA
ncbi:nucleotide disphospho-sugar-binding domain-containing protein [Hamadaea tsunoensis]|uniref:nucleotide disphospho-sugar-binding domain-containing protein n=1 Tax=Hamadaea tsunoensis TaxID=53368 RepID=UPI00042403DA|nr:nucleotide disphospho-sugar-binding domain-containing protein [Hamadaea tsunoensis]